MFPQKRSTSKKLELFNDPAVTGRIAFKTEQIKNEQVKEFAENIYMPEMPETLLYQPEEQENYFIP